jgi:uncharacterized protein YndB with AHSA1/START domain
MSENEKVGMTTTQVDGKTDVRPGEDVRELVFTRVIDAPRALVFRAWTDPVYFARWWGPHGMTNPICDIDLRPGGAFRIVMQDEAGGQYPVSGTYIEIAEPERLVITLAATDHPPEWHDQLNQYLPHDSAEPALQQTWTVTFEEHGGGKTRLTIVDRFATGADRDGAMKLGHREGVSQSLERLAALTESQ